VFALFAFLAIATPVSTSTTSFSPGQALAIDVLTSLRGIDREGRKTITPNEARDLFRELPAEEQRAFLTQWERTAKPVGREQTLYRDFRELAGSPIAASTDTQVQHDKTRKHREPPPQERRVSFSREQIELLQSSGQKYGFGAGFVLTGVGGLIGAGISYGLVHDQENVNKMPFVGIGVGSLLFMIIGAGLITSASSTLADLNDY
jgi:hypothetical protein